MRKRAPYFLVNLSAAPFSPYSIVSITEIVRVLTHKDSVVLKLSQNLASVFYVIVADLRYLQYLFNTLLGRELFK